MKKSPPEPGEALPLDGSRRTRSGGRRLSPLVSSVLLAWACAPGGSEPARPELPTRPNVLLIIVDTLRADHLGCYGFGRDTSPHVDSWASGGRRFERYYTVAPTTLVSFTSFLTARYPNSHGVFRNGVAWPSEIQGVQQTFRDAGYDASYAVSSRFGLSRGFDHFDEDLDVAVKGLPQKLIRRGESVTNAVRRWLERRGNPERPFFALIHYFDPHWPYQPPPPLDEMFDPHYEGPVDGDVDDLRRMRRRLRLREGEPDDDTRHLHALHLGEIRYMDEQVGRLLETLRERSLLDRTLVAFTADHGETIDEHYDYFNHGLTVYDTNIRIPLIVSGPGVAPGVEPSPWSSIDLAPTLLRYAGLPVPSVYEGHSFLSSLLGRQASRPVSVFAEATKREEEETDEEWPNRRNSRCVIRGRFKLVHSPWRDDRRELFDLIFDPGERNDLHGAPPRKASAGLSAMAAELRAWSQRTPEVVGRSPEHDPQVVDRLRSLGYAD